MLIEKDDAGMLADLYPGATYHLTPDVGSNHKEPTAAAAPFVLKSKIFFATLTELKLIHKLTPNPPLPKAKLLVDGT